MMDWVKLVVAFNIPVAVCVWLPSAIRVIKRRSSSDYSLWTFVLVGWLQLSNAAIAHHSHNGALFTWFAVNALLVGTMGGIVWWFRNGDKREGVGF